MPKFSAPNFTAEYVAQKIREYMAANPPAGGLPPTNKQVSDAVTQYMTQFPAPQGPKGDQGEVAARGPSVFTGNGSPPSGSYTDGDTYLDASTGDIYKWGS